ncbi:expressed unknown protein [Seminavis robusta]|uniref:Uncharacterized protein n=1 Tax=Seminavis robusta TaxID=568900 RepID=A0A9N8EGS7_9STRA|nr:expressed unknown protein [Seminavis robusta]|eukprot:Sro1104_g241871.1  (103) ;mRNA; f:34627-34935
MTRHKSQVSLLATMQTQTVLGDWTLGEPALGEPAPAKVGAVGPSCWATGAFGPGVAELGDWTLGEPALGDYVVISHPAESLGSVSKTPFWECHMAVPKLSGV